MNKTEGASRSSVSLFLTELIAAVLIFILCVTVCVTLFSGAFKTSRESFELTKAVAAAQNAAEVFKGDYDSGFRLLLGMEKTGENRYEAGYDESWLPGGDAYSIVVTVRPESNGGIRTADINVSGAGVSLYSLTVEALSGGGADNG